MVSRRMEWFSMIFAFIMVSWALLPFFNLGGMTVNDNTIVSSTILILLGIAYPIVVFMPQWNKAILLIEGVVFASVGFIFLDSPNNFLFLILGGFLVIISILAYIRKLPKGFLKFFYQRPR